MTGQQLKNSILQEAIEGRLVPQDPNDEPASVLLERIRAEKERLVKEKKIKKNKNKNESNADVLYTEQVNFDIPESWCWTTLGKICVFLSRGKSPKYSEIDKTYPVFAQKCNLKEGGISLEQARFLDPSTLSRWDDTYKLRTGDVLINSTGTGTVCRTRLFDENCLGKYPFVVPDSHVTVVRTTSQICSKFVLAYISSKQIQQYLEDNLAGSTNQKELYIGVLENLSFPLPPLAEQHRIVEKIESLLPKVEAYGKAQEELVKLTESLPEQLKKSILQEAIEGRLVPQDPNDEPASILLERIRAEKARLVKEKKIKKDKNESRIYRTEDGHWMEHFEDKSREDVCIDEEIPFDIPENWEWCRVSNIFIINPKVKTDDNTLAAFIPMEKIAACYSSKYDYDVRKWGDIKSGFTCFADGDVAFAKITPCFQNRKSVIFDNLPNGIGAGTTELKVLRQYAETIDRKYVLYFLKSSYFVEQAKFKGTANQQRIIVGYLENKLFPLPPLAEQHRIVEKIESLLPKIEKMKMRK